MSDNKRKVKPGYVEVPGKGTRYQDSSGNYYSNHAGPVLNQIGDFFGGIGPAYEGYYNSFADAVGTERRDGTVRGKLSTLGPNYKKREQKLSDIVTKSRPAPNEPPKETVTELETSTRKLDGTVTSPNTGNVPTNWADYEKFLKGKSIQLASAKNAQSSFESNSLPTQREAIDYSTIMKGDGNYNDSLYGGKLLQDDMTMSGVLSNGTGYGENYSELYRGLDPQSGASGLADQLEQSRAIEVDQAGKRRRPSGARQREMFDRRNPDFGQEEVEIEKGSGLSARSRALLDAPMGEGPAMTMRRVNAAQGIMRSGGKIGVKGADGGVTEISQKGYDEIRSNNRDNTDLSQNFLKQYMITPSKPADSQSNDSLNPVTASKDLSGEASTSQEAVYPNAIQLMDMDTSGIPSFLEEREPYMRNLNIFK